VILKHEVGKSGGINLCGKHFTTENEQAGSLLSPHDEVGNGGEKIFAKVEQGDWFIAV